LLGEVGAGVSAGVAAFGLIAGCLSTAQQAVWGNADAAAPDAAAESSTPFDAAARDTAQEAPAGNDAGTGEPEGGPADAADEPPGWTLTWSDEFNGPNGSAPDPTKWNNEVGGDGWGNKELEYYTGGTANVVVQNGNLVITATAAGASPSTCWYGPCRYTSARLNTAGNFSQQYGRFEARLQVPFGQGLWPAFWLLGDNIGTVGWPACGEIDVMENVGFEPSQAWGSLHAPLFDATLAYTLAAMGRFADDFHTFAVEWEATQIRFYVDDQLYEAHTPVDATSTGGTWAFDQPFFVILNVAVGGNWPGSPDATTAFPQTMKVDWVRVYSKG
jgi:beta-glucanase (GH16 family)